MTLPPTTIARCPLCRHGELSDRYSVRADDIRTLFRRSGIDAADLASVGVLTLRGCRGCDLRFFDPCIVGDDAFYSQLHDIEWYYPAAKPEFAVAASAIGDATSVLEVGCGRGSFAEHLHARTRYVGLELSTRAVESANAAGRDVRNQLVGEHAEQHPEAYAAVVSFQVLEHVADPRAFLLDCMRCLAPGGLLVLSVPSEDGFMGQIRNNCFNLPPHHVTRWTDACLRNIASLIDAELVSLTHDELGADHHGVVAAHLLQNALGLGRAGSRRVRVSRGYFFLERLLRPAVRRLAESLPREGLVPHGHSVTVVIRKRS